MVDYILDARNYLPDFLKASPIMDSIMDCLNVLISDEKSIFEESKSTFQETKEAYNDMLYKVRDYSKLSVEAKIEMIKELGFDYILDIIELTPEQLTQLITFFNLIYSLKGKREGLELCLDILGLVYEYVVWDETEPQGQKFTARLTIIGNDYQELKVFKKIKNFVRSYMLPWIDVIIDTTVRPTEFYLSPIWGAMTRYKEYSTQHEAIGEVSYLRIQDIHNVLTVAEMSSLPIRMFKP